MLSFHQLIRSSEWYLPDDCICTLREQANAVCDVKFAGTCYVVNFCITLETSNIQWGVPFQIVLYYLVPAKQKSMGFYSCWFLSVKHKFKVVKSSFLVLKKVMGVHSYKDEQGRCVRNTGFRRERNKIKMQSRVFMLASSPLTQADPSLPLALFATSSLSLLYFMLLQEGWILLYELQCPPGVHTTLLWYMSFILFMFVAMQHKIIQNNPLECCICQPFFNILLCSVAWIGHQPSFYS